MKALILTLLLIFSVFAHAEQRFTDKEKEEFLKEARIETQEFKTENQGKFDLQLLKPYIFQALDDQRAKGNIDRKELQFIKSELDKYAKDPANNSDEEKFFKAFEQMLNEITKTKLEKVKKGGICNDLKCDKDLKCAVDPKQDTEGKKCSVGLKECKLDSDCCSGACEELKGKKLCAPIRRCFESVKVGGSCNESPVCEKGTCLPFDANTNGIGECSPEKSKCNKDVDCCSNACSRGMCVENLICKDCSRAGEKAKDGKKCCEGLYKGEGGVCVPDAPPIVPPQVNNNLRKFISFFIDSAYAGDAYNTVNGNRSKYGNFTAKQGDKDTVNFKGASAGLGFKLKSDFEKCDMHFREDFYQYLIQNKLFDQEIALLAFDFMAMGELNPDYMRTSKNNELSSINGRLQAVANKHDTYRTKTNDKIAEINRKLTCMCIDVVGLSKLNDPAKTEFFNKQCGEYKKAYADDQTKASCNNLANEQQAYKDSCGNGPASGMTQEDCTKLQTALSDKEKTCSTTGPESFIDDVAQGDASGVKAKRMLVFFTQQMSSFNQKLTVDNTRVYQGIANVKNWMTSTGYEKLYSATDEKTIDLKTFTIEGSGGTARAMGAGVLVALLTAGVLAVLGGFAIESLVAAAGAAGIVAAAGVWVIASLKGAWMVKRPIVADEFVREHSCGKKGKSTCTDWKRTLKQPYNTVCDSHISATGCVKNFLVYRKDDSGERYIIDPFIPVGMTKAGVLRGQGDLARSLDEGYKRALEAMQGKARSGQVSESYMWEDFIDESIVAKYAPQLTGTPEADYVLNENIANSIKENAKKFAIEKKFLEQTDVENLNKFAEYAYAYHFVWPKTSIKGEISYPTSAFDAYLDFMANGVAASLTAGGANAALTFGGLNSKYLEDYLNTLKIYEEQATNLSDAQKAGLQAEIANTQAQIAQMKLISDMVGTGSEIDKDAINAALEKNGSSKDLLSGDQKEFLQAIGSYRKLRNEQVKKAEAYKKAVNSGEISKERAAQVAKVSSSFAQKFSSPLSASLSKGGSGGGGSATDAIAPKDGSSLFNYKPNYGTSAIGSSYNSGSSSYGKSSASTSKTTGSDNNSSAAVEDEDSKRLAEAINARDKSNSSKFQSSDENTLFEKVTNAYIRNYDKVLTKKKQEKDLGDTKKDQ